MSPLQATVLRLLQRHPEGLTLADVMTATDGTHYQCSTALRALRDDKAAASTIGAKGKVRWSASEHLDALKASIKAARQEASALARQRTSLRHLTSEQREAEEAAAAEFVGRPMRREVIEQACWAGRVAVPGPTSVFDLARTAA